MSGMKPPLTKPCSGSGPPALDWLLLAGLVLKLAELQELLLLGLLVQQQAGCEVSVWSWGCWWGQCAELNGRPQQLWLLSCG